MLSKEQVLQISKLAKLSLSDAEAEKFRSLLGETIDYVKVLEELDLSQVLPTLQVTSITNAQVSDEPKKSLTKKEVLTNAPNKDESYVKTKAVLNKVSDL